METIMISVDRFTKSAQDVADRAADIMQRYNHHQIDAEHMLLALLEQPQGVVSQLLELLKVDANALAEGLDAILRTSRKGEIVEVGAGQVSITPRVVQTIDLAIEETNRLQDELISTEHLFLGILGEHDTPATRLLEGEGLTRERAYDAIQQMRG
jgi:ATP-dependent Clp protease ATP-binding subunit ClpC